MVMTPVFLFHVLATCEMCGMVGVRDAFYSKTKRFCSVSCSRSYSSNSKKASILARLQVTVQKPSCSLYVISMAFTVYLSFDVIHRTPLCLIGQLSFTPTFSGSRSAPSVELTTIINSPGIVFRIN